MHKSILYALCFILFIIPFRNILGSYEPLIITFNIFSFGMICLSFISCISIVSLNTKYYFNYLDFFIILLCLIYFSSTIFSKNLIETGRLAYQFMFIPIISYFTIKSIVSSEKEYQIAMIAIIFGITLFSIIALFKTGMQGLRQCVLGINPIDIGTLSIFAIFNLYYTGWWKKRIGLISLVLNMLLLFISLSRAYFIGLFLSPFIFMLIRKGYSLIIFILLISITLFSTLLLTQNASFIKPHETTPDEFRTANRLTDISLWKRALYGRALTYQEGLMKFKKNIFFGTGIQIGKQNITIHNFHVEWLQYGGIIGYLAYLLVFLAWYKMTQPFGKQDFYCATHILTVTIVLLNSSTNGIMHGMMPHFIFISIGFAEARRKTLQQS